MNKEKNSPPKIDILHASPTIAVLQNFSSNLENTTQSMVPLEVVVAKEEQHVLNNAFYDLHISSTNNATQNRGVFFLFE